MRQRTTPLTREPRVTSPQFAAQSNAMDQYAVLAVGAPSHPLRGVPMAQYQAYPPGPPPADPGRTLGIVGLILAFFCSLIGLIISIIAYRQSQQAGYKNNIALAGIIVGAVSLAFGLILQFTGALAGLWGSG